MSIIISAAIVASAGKFLIRGSSTGVGLHRLIPTSKQYSSGIMLVPMNESEAAVHHRYFLIYLDRHIRVSENIH